MKLVLLPLSNNISVKRYSVCCLVYYIIYNTYSTNDKRGTAILTTEFYNDIIHYVKEMNSFGGHLIKGNMTNYICIDTYKVPAYSGTGENVDTLLSNIKIAFMIYLKFNLMSPGRIWSYLLLAVKPFKCNSVS